MFSLQNGGAATETSREGSEQLGWNLIRIKWMR